MQKVGMSDEENRKTIKRQIRLVFALPLAGAVLHTVVGMNMAVVLMGAVHNYEVRGDAALYRGCLRGVCACQQHLLYANPHGMLQDREEEGMICKKEGVFDRQYVENSFCHEQKKR